MLVTYSDGAIKEFDMKFLQNPEDPLTNNLYLERLSNHYTKFQQPDAIYKIHERGKTQLRDICIN